MHRPEGSFSLPARGAPEPSLRLYVNDTLIAPATVGRDGTVTFTIGQGMKSGGYKVRLDRVDPTTGKVRDRAEVPFTAPDAGHDEGVEYAAAQPGEARPAAAPVPDTAGGRPSEHAVTTGPRPGGPVQPTGTGSLTADGHVRAWRRLRECRRPQDRDRPHRARRHLWTISRRTYGEGERYTLIYDANQDQVRDPDLIYPGQVLVLPDKGVIDADQDGKRD